VKDNPFKRIMVTSDGSESAQRAVNVAISLSLGLGSTLVAVHIIDDKLIQPFDVLEDEGKDILKSIRLQGEDAGLKVEEIIIFGNPLSDMAKIVTKGDADLLVIGTHGRSGLNKIIRGSVAENALHKVNIPVTLVK
jgi:nucleotide-binding universal stress UspA family protein